MSDLQTVLMAFALTPWVGMGVVIALAWVSSLFRRREREIEPTPREAAMCTRWWPYDRTGELLPEELR